MCSSLLRLAAEKIVGWFAVTISHLSVFPSFVTMQNQNFFFFSNWGANEVVKRPCLVTFFG